MSTADLISGCNSGENMARKGDVRDATSPPADTSLAEQALLMWLRWNAAYELLTSKMFEQRQNLEELHAHFGSGRRIATQRRAAHAKDSRQMTF